MERDYLTELKNHEVYQFLRRNENCNVYWISEYGEYRAVFKCNTQSVYFYKEDGYYDRIEMSEDNSKYLLDKINTIVRIEKEIENKWLPVWTVVDGFIDTDYQNFAYIGNRYYTFNELEVFIKELKSFKKIIANFKVY